MISLQGFSVDHMTDVTQPGGAAWIAQLTKQNQTNVDYNDEWYRNRLRALQAVDEMVAELDARLDQHGIAEDTYLIFTTDNGYHVGQHRLQPGKQCSYKEDINIPFIVRGPGVPNGHTSNVVTSHTDLAATFLDIAGAPPRLDLDGEAMPLTNDAMVEAKIYRQEHVNVEMWGIIMSEGKYGADLHNNHTYKALRIIGKGYNLRYTVWCNGDHELYDLQVNFSSRSCHSISKKCSHPTERPPRAAKHLRPRPHVSFQPLKYRRSQDHLQIGRTSCRAQDMQSSRMHASMGSATSWQQCALIGRCAEPWI